MDDVPAANLLLSYTWYQVYAQCDRGQAQQRTISNQGETTTAQKYWCFFQIKN